MQKSFTLPNGLILTCEDSLETIKAAFAMNGFTYKPTKAELRVAEYRKAFSDDEFMEAFFEFIENKPAKMEALQKKRKAIKEKLK